MHSYYHLVLLILSYCSVGFLVFRRPTRKHLVILADVVSGCITFSEASCLARKCGTHISDSPVKAL
jgi:hypothetical protein